MFNNQLLTHQELRYILLTPTLTRAARKRIEVHYGYHQRNRSNAKTYNTRDKHRV